MTHEILEDRNRFRREGRPRRALTSITNNIFRAYEIADEFRRRGVPVVMGGFHATVEPEEALASMRTPSSSARPRRHGRNSSEDFRTRETAPHLQAPSRPSLEALPAPKVRHPEPAELPGIGRKARTVAEAFASRHPRSRRRAAVPQACDFCDITQFRGGDLPSPARRPMSSPKSRPGAPGSSVSLTTTSLPSTRAAKELFRALVPLKIRWVGQGTLAAAEDEELLALARRSGCRDTGRESRPSRRQAWPRWGRTASTRVDSYRQPPAGLPESGHRCRCQHDLRVRRRRPGRLRRDL